jgi:hypothetical protein
MLPHVRDALSQLRAAGVKDVTVLQNNHVKIAWRNAAGRKVTLVTGASPSDRHALHAQRRILRRLLEGGAS